MIPRAPRTQGVSSEEGVAASDLLASTTATTERRPKSTTFAFLGDGERIELDHEPSRRLQLVCSSGMDTFIKGAKSAVQGAKDVAQKGANMAQEGVLHVANKTQEGMLHVANKTQEGAAMAHKHFKSAAEGAMAQAMQVAEQAGKGAKAANQAAKEMRDLHKKTLKFAKVWHFSRPVLLANALAMQFVTQ